MIARRALAHVSSRQLIVAGAARDAERVGVESPIAVSPVKPDLVSEP